MTEHIDGSRLSQDLRYRFEYISKFLNFTIDDIRALNSLAAIAVPLTPVVVDTLYRKLFQFDITKNFFVFHNDGFDGRSGKDQLLTLSYTETLLIDTVWTRDNIENKSKKEIILALNQVFHIQNDLFLLHYLEPSKETIPSSSSYHKCACS